MALEIALLVTPDRSNQSFLATALEARGLEVLRAEDFEHAHAIFLRHRPAGVVIEYPIHVAGGIDLVRELQPFRASATKVVAIVAHGPPEGHGAGAVSADEVDLLLHMPMAAGEIAARSARLFWTDRESAGEAGRDWRRRVTPPEA
jgi:DNA-binding response OmpR family regulator